MTAENPNRYAQLGFGESTQIISDPTPENALRKVAIDQSLSRNEANAELEKILGSVHVDKIISGISLMRDEIVEEGIESLRNRLSFESPKESLNRSRDIEFTDINTVISVSPKVLKSYATGRIEREISGLEASIREEEIRWSEKDSDVPEYQVEHNRILNDLKKQIKAKIDKKKNAENLVNVAQVGAAINRNRPGIVGRIDWVSRNFRGDRKYDSIGYDPWK